MSHWIFNKKVTDLKVEQFAAKLSEAGVVLLDVRTDEEFKDGHLKGAIQIDFHHSDFPDQISKLDKEKTYAVYCRSGHRSGETVKYMISNGFKSAFNLAGGIIAWNENGNQVVKV